MPLIEWSDKFSVGIPSIDAQHKKLVGMANELCDAMEAGHGTAVLKKTLEGLIGYTVTHFKYEEKLFAGTGYEASAAHKGEHEELTRQVLAIQEKVEKGMSSAQCIQLMICLRDWLTNHILRSDKGYAAHLIANKIS